MNKYVKSTILGALPSSGARCIKQKSSLFVVLILEKFSIYYSLFKIVLNIVTQEDERQDSFDGKIVEKIRFFFDTEKLNVEIKEDKVLN